MSTTLSRRDRPAVTVRIAVPAVVADRPVVTAGVVMILAQLGFRAWALYGSWFQGDDFVFMSRVMHSRLSARMLLDPYAGHVMPGGFFLSWINAQISPLNYNLPATEMLVMQAVASVGCLALLVHAFGERRHVLPLLAIYLFSVITLPAFIWWAAGVNQLPLQIAFFWGLYTHLSYLRTRRPRYAVYTMLIAIGSFVFYEKTLLLFPVFLFLAIAYFADGDIVARVRTVWTKYRPGVLMYSAVAGAYFAFYALWGLNFSPDTANRQPLVPVALRMVGWAFTTGILGGPVHWDTTAPSAPGSLARPSQVIVAVAWVILFSVVFHAARTRKRSLRAWLIPLWFLVADVLLVGAGRVGFVGPDVALDYRYQSELAGAVVLALGLSVLPLLGARESAEPTRTSAFYDAPMRIGVAAVAVVAVALTSSIHFVAHWQGATQARDYFANVQHDLARRPATVPLVNTAVPEYVIWALAFPANVESNALRMFASHTRYPNASTDSLYMINNVGKIKPAGIPATRRNLPGPDGPCGYRMPSPSGVTVVPLDGPVFGAWWLRVGYYSSLPTPVTLSMGDVRYSTRFEQGLHSLYLQWLGRGSTVTISGLNPATSVCVTDLTLGLPQPVPNGP